MATFDLFFVGGQSNAAGRGTSGPSVPAGVGYEYVHGSGLENPLADPTDGAVTGSAWPAFCIEYHAITGRAACLVIKASGGTAQTDAAASGATNHWDAGDGVLFPQSVTVINDTLADLTGDGHTFRLRGILWCQGERDAQVIDSPGTINKAAYKAALVAMIARYRGLFGEDLPFLICRTGHRDAGDTQGFIDVRAAQDEVAAADGSTYVVTTSAADFPETAMMADDLHYTQAGYDLMGTEAATGTAAALRNRAVSRGLVMAGGTLARVG